MGGLLFEVRQLNKKIRRSNWLISSLSAFKVALHLIQLVGTYIQSVLFEFDEKKLTFLSMAKCLIIMFYTLGSQECTV